MDYPLYWQALSPKLRKWCNEVLLEYTYQVNQHRNEISKLTGFNRQNEWLRMACSRNILMFTETAYPSLERDVKLEIVKQNTKNPKTGEYAYSGFEPDAYYLGLHGVFLALFQVAVMKKLKLVLMAPRGFGKTVCFSTIGTAWLATSPSKDKLRVPEWFYVTASASIAEDKSNYLRADMEASPSFTDLWGQLKGDIWNKDRFKLSNGFIAYFTGYGSQTRGPHPGGVCLDDLETRETARSKTMTNGIFEWFFSDFMGQLGTKDPLIILGTNVGRGTLLDTLMNDPLTGLPRTGFLSVRIEACHKGVKDNKVHLSNSIWPTVWPAKELQRRFQEIGEWAFDSEYLNRPHSSEEPVFRREWVERNFVEEADLPPPESRDLLLAIDPAYALKDKDDFTGIVEVYVSKREGSDFGMVYIADAHQHKWTNEEKADYIITTHITKKPLAFFLETQADKRALHDYIVHRCSSLGILPTIVPVETGGKDKYTRALSVQGLVQTGRVKFLRGKYLPFVSQLLNFTGSEGGDHDDMVDALIYVLKQTQIWYLPKNESKNHQVSDRITTKLMDFISNLERDKKSSKKNDRALHPIFGTPLPTR